MSEASASKNKAYWACQIIGWGSYTAIGMYATASLAGPQPSIFIGYSAFFFYSIGLTHLLRREIRRRGWLLMPFRNSAPRLLGASLLTAAIMCGLVIGVSSAVERQISWGAGGTSALIARMKKCLIKAAADKRVSYTTLLAAASAEMGAISKERAGHASSSFT